MKKGHNQFNISFKSFMIVVLIFLIIAFFVRNPLFLVFIIGAILLCYYLLNNTKSAKAKKKKQKEIAEQKRKEEFEFWNGKTEIVAEKKDGKTEAKIIHTDADPKFKVWVRGRWVEGIPEKIAEPEKLEQAFKFTNLEDWEKNKKYAFRKLHGTKEKGKKFSDNFKGYVKEIQENSSFAYEFYNCFGSTFEVDSAYGHVLIFDKDGKKAFLLQIGDNSYWDSDYIGCAEKKEKLEFLKELSPDLKDYNDILGNKIEFTASLPDSSHWQKAEGIEWK